jgi:hypothetical protein
MRHPGTGQTGAVFTAPTFRSRKLKRQRHFRIGETAINLRTGLLVRKSQARRFLPEGRASKAAKSDTIRRLHNGRIQRGARHQVLRDSSVSSKGRRLIDLVEKRDRPRPDQVLLEDSNRNVRANFILIIR